MKGWEERADELARAAYERGEPLGWFDLLYTEARGGAVEMPWSRTDPHPALLDWVSTRRVGGRGRRAVVCGAGLGADAEFTASLGFDTVAIDISPAAVAECRRRHPDSPVDYRVADLLVLPTELVGRFDLVVEIFTLQAMPDPPRTAAGVGVRSLLAPGGTLVVVQFRYDGSVGQDDGPPFALDRAVMASLADAQVELVRLEELPGPLWRGTYQRSVEP